MEVRIQLPRHHNATFFAIHDADPRPAAASQVMAEVNQHPDVVAPPDYTIVEVNIPDGSYATPSFDSIESDSLNEARSCPIHEAHPADPFNEACSCPRRGTYHVQDPLRESDSDSGEETPATESCQREPVAARLFGRHARIAHGAFSGFLYLVLCVAYTSMTTFIGWRTMTVMVEPHESSACVFEIFSAATAGTIILAVMSLYVWMIARLLVKESQRLQDHGIDPFGRKVPRWWREPRTGTLLPASPRQIQRHDWAQYPAHPVYMALAFLLSGLYGPALGLSLLYGGRNAPEGMPTTTDALAWGAFGMAFSLALFVMMAMMTTALSILRQKIRYRV
ncbi:uncharacterized protein B0H18DRAFT_113558 [Fomitopsis serialis]|uniref:uncharacterized protein n=1 Tax=Fomitopsis serialis TaxID=139415 RepID=UPI002008BC5E|nr:uncharacterized protein B0H18DRAFT_113558 [Neoantrodia serialis]KAH9914989.1 hypothetical protein B0H18DRAFT_113558 [Neoantrodia serialis]